jgi:hypothetical protein
MADTDTEPTLTANKYYIIPIKARHKYTPGIYYYVTTLEYVETCPGTDDAVFSDMISMEIFPLVLTLEDGYSIIKGYAKVHVYVDCNHPLGSKDKVLLKIDAYYENKYLYNVHAQYFIDASVGSPINKPCNCFCPQTSPTAKALTPTTSPSTTTATHAPC